MTAATVALLSGPAFAATTVTACDTTNTTDYSNTNATSGIVTKVTMPLCTDTADKGAPGDITIATDGTVLISSKVTTPIIITVNSSVTGSDINNVTTVAGTTISANDADSATGIEIVSSATDGVTPYTINGGLDLSGTLDLTGTGSTKKGIYLMGTGTYAGNIVVEAGSIVEVTGNSSAGIYSDLGTTLNGNLTIDGSVSAGSVVSTTKSTTKAATSDSSPQGIYIGGNLTGSFDVGSGASVSAIGSAAQGVVVAGNIGGSFTNEGAISVTGTTTPKGTGDPAPDSAVILAGNITGGFDNAGPISTSDTLTVVASITTTGSSAALIITPGTEAQVATGPSEIGDYADTNGLGSTYSFINRGTISAHPVDPNLSAIAASIYGSDTDNVIFAGGFYNSGTIIASSSSSKTSSVATTAIGLDIGGGVQIGGPFTNDGASSTAAGVISASISGTDGGSAIALEIGNPENATPTTLNELDNTGTIEASATTTNLTLVPVSGAASPLEAVAIVDESGTLSTINNSGTIAASATTLTDNSQVTIAADLSANTAGVNFTNTGTVIGDIKFGIGNDTLTIGGGQAASAAVTGNINFSSGDDQLIINTYGELTGKVFKDAGVGTLDVTVAAAGSLYLQNTNTTLNVENFNVDGNLGLTLSQHLIDAPIVKATGALTLGTDTNLSLGVGSFFGNPGVPANFILFQAPSGSLAVVDPSTINTAIQNGIPFLFEGTVCAYGVSGFSPCSGTSSGQDQVVLGLTPKSLGTTNTDETPGLALSSFAATMFAPANRALVNDDALGAAVIEAGLPGNMTASPTQAPASYNAEGQRIYNGIYDQFAPDVTDAAREIAVSLTDPVTGPVAARQRALRMYANQPGETTLWGQEFAQRIDESGSTPGGQFRDTGFGFVMGADGGNPRDGRYGAAFTFYSGDVNEKAPRLSKTSTLWYMLTGYTDWRGKGFFFDSQFSAGLGDFTSKRSIRITADNTGDTIILRTATGKRTGLLGSGGITSGFILTAGSTVLTPLVSLDGLMMREDAYSETGGGGVCTTTTTTTVPCDGFDLKVNPSYTNSLRAFAGTNVREDFNFGGFFFQPEFRVGYRYDFLNSPAKIKGAFVSDPTDTFTLTGPDPGQGNLVLGGSLSVTTDAWSIGLNYDYIRSTGGSINQIGTITLLGRI